MSNEIKIYMSKVLGAIALLSFAMFAKELTEPLFSVAYGHWCTVFLYFFIFALSIFSIILWKELNSPQRTKYKANLQFMGDYWGEGKDIFFEAKTDKEARIKAIKIGHKETKKKNKHCSDPSEWSFYVWKIDKLKRKQEVWEEIYQKT